MLAHPAAGIAIRSGLVGAAASGVTGGTDWSPILVAIIGVIGTLGSATILAIVRRRNGAADRAVPMSVYEDTRSERDAMRSERDAERTLRLRVERERDELADEQRDLERLIEAHGIEVPGD